MQTEVIRGHLMPQWLSEDGWTTAAPDRVIEGSIVFRPIRHTEILEAIHQGGSPPRTLTDVNRWFAPDPVVVMRMTGYLEDSGLFVSAPTAEGLYLDFSGTVAAVTKAFRCTFAERLVDGRQVYLNREEPQVPLWAVSDVVAIVGLENRSQAQPAHRYPTKAAHPANNGLGFFPQDLKSAYNFPGLTGQGETIGLLEFSNGYNALDLDLFWQQHGIRPAQVTFVSVDGTPNDQGGNAIDMECTLDLEWAGAMAPDAHLVVYEASAGSNNVAFAQSMLKALEAAIADEAHAPKVLSISYGDAEDRFPPKVLHAWDLAVQRALARGIVVLAASGDMGSYGLRGFGLPYPHVDAPASLPHIVAVGGTTLQLNAEQQRVREVGWSDTNGNGASGGGVSLVFSGPPWQQNAHVPLNPEGLPGRGVPDVALVADPDTGYNVVFQGQSTVIGGTSASTPTWAGLLALINQSRRVSGKAPLGFVSPALYRLGRSEVFHDITQGNNSVDGIAGYACGPGWDAVTGWGSVDGSALSEHLG